MKFSWNRKSAVYGRDFTLSFKDLKDALNKKSEPDTLPKKTCIAIKLASNSSESIINLFLAVANNYCFRLTPETFPLGKNIKEDNFHLPHSVANSPPSFIVQTGGTTGSSKQILRSQNTWIRSFKINRKKWQISDCDSYGILGDLSHSISLYGLLEGLYLGTDVNLLRENLPQSQLAVIADREISVLYATPIQLQLLIRAFEIHHRKPIPTLRLVIVGGSKLSANLSLQLAQLFPAAEMVEFYGTAETSFITVASPNSPQGSVGKAYEGVKIRVVNDRGEVLSNNKIGNIEVLSPYLFEGYIGDGQVSFRLNDYFQTGERGLLDEEGNLFLKGRRDRIISIHDVNIHPEVIENFLETLPGVEAAYVYPMSENYRVNHLHCCIFYDSIKPDESEIVGKCRKELGHSHTPKSLKLIRGKPPLLLSGKLDLATLKTGLELGRW